jgi:hypothetical protein
MLADFAVAKGFTVDQLKSFGVRQGQRHVEIPYYEMSGAERARVRLRSAIAARDGSSWSEGDAELVPYGLHRPVPWDKAYAFIVEGESDCWALWSNNKPALGIPGASNAKCLRLEHVRGATSLYVVREPGVAGARFPHKVADRLYSQGFAGAVYAIDIEKAKDPLDLWQIDPGNFEVDLRAAIVGRELIKRPEPVPESETGVRSLTSLLARPRKKVSYVVDGLLPEGGILLAVAPPKAGKSKTLRTLARSVALGEPFLGRDTIAGPVVWARLEEPYDAFIADLVAIGAADFGDRFFTNETMPPADVMRWFDAVVRERRPSLVVIDTWAKLTRVDDIGNYSKVNAANEPLMRYARDLGIAQVWVHHSTDKGEVGKRGGKAVLGSTALFGACDTLMVIERYPNDVRAVSTQQRIGEDMPETQIAMDPETGLITIATGKSGIRNGQIEERIIGIIASEPGIAKADILDRIEARKADVLSSLASLEERDLIENVSKGVKGDPSRYEIRVKNRIIAREPAVLRFGSSENVIQFPSRADSVPENLGSVPEKPASPPPRGSTAGDIPLDVSRIPTPDSRIPTPDSRIPSTDSRIPSTDSRIPSTDSRIPTPDSRIPSTDSRIPSTDSRIPSTDSRIPSTDSRIPTPDSHSVTPDTATCNKDICLPLLDASSGIRDLDTSVPHTVSPILIQAVCEYPVSRTPDAVSRQTSDAPRGMCISRIPYHGGVA